MSETGFVLFQYIVAGVETFLYAACMTFFLYPFMAGWKGQGKDTVKKILTAFLAYMTVYLAGGAASVPGWLCMVIVTILLVSRYRWLHMERSQIFLLSVLFFCMKDMSRLITESLYYIFNRKLLQGIYDENMIYRNVAAGYSGEMILRFLLLSAMLLLISRMLQKGPLELHRKELCYLCLIPLTSIMFGNIIFRLFLTVKDNVFFSLYEQYPAFIGLVPLISILFYAGMAATIVSYQEMVRLQAEKNRYFVEEQQLLAIRERMEEVEQFYDGIRRMKHEMKNHLTNIKGLAGSGSYEEMEQYIARMDESMDVFEITIRTGNAVTDVIINDKKKAADRLGMVQIADMVKQLYEWFFLKKNEIKKKQKNISSELLESFGQQITETEDIFQDDTHCAPIN